ncbi:MAG: DUF4446 family protein, partial [Candidatus Moranbacteria bacterium]|nr:DUF4446 family protein [Candidatus Moranbacteria bacterium]
AIGFCTYIFLSLRRLRKNLRPFFAGKGAKDFEEVIVEHSKTLASFDGDISELYDITNRINTISKHSINHIGVVRFNPFGDIGGKQSFAVAFVDVSGSGVVFSSLHGRESTRIYAKHLVGGESADVPLSDEEKQAISSAAPLIPKKL